MSGSERHRAVVDAIVAVALTAVSVVSAAVLSSETDPPRAADALGYALIVIACLPLVVRRRLPVPVLAVSSIAVAVYLVLGYPYTVVMLAVSIAVYSVCRRQPLLPALVLSGVTLLVLLVHIFVNPASLPGFFGVIPAAAWIAIPATIGISRRLILEARARERAEAESRLREQERLRVAGEVHDVVGHGLAAIQMQADIALHLAHIRPEQGLKALEAISTASSSALVELREALRELAPGGEGEGAPRVPAAGLSRLDELCDRIRAAGVDVEVSIVGTPRSVAAAVDLAAYRIIQEALTNIVRHAMSPRAVVELEYSPADLSVSVTSPHDGSAIAEGFGIRGIRRRVSSLGGTVAIRVGESLRVHVILPDTDSDERLSGPAGNEA